MAREWVPAGNIESLEFEWLVDESTRPTGAEVRVYIVKDGAKQYWNGTEFTITDATLAGTFANGVWTGQFAYPGETIGYEVFIEARPTGLPEIAEARIIDSRYVVNPPTPPVAKTSEGSPLMKV